MKLGTQKLAFHINLLPYLNNLRADHTGNKGTVMRKDGTELRLNTSQWVKTNCCPKYAISYPTWINISARKQGQLVPLKSYNLSNYTQPQADRNFHTEKISALRIPSLCANDTYSSTKRPL
jgi:hypothetical protein